MSGNYPPGTGPNDPNAPWNQPDYTELLPAVCEECHFMAETFNEMEEHEHDIDVFRRPKPDPEPEPEPSEHYIDNK